MNALFDERDLCFIGLILIDWVAVIIPVNEK